jgi:transcriptional regulator with XRE-family HTH domain
MQKNGENITSLIERLSKYLDYKEDSFNKLASRIGVSNSYFSKMIRSKGSIGADIVEKILLYYDDLNSDWLITGRGEMLNRPENIKAPPGVSEGNKSLFFELIKEKEKRIDALERIITTKDKLLSKYEEENSSSEDEQKRKRR